MRTSSLFLKFDKRDDDQQVVEGLASTEAVDSDGEVMEYEAVKEAGEDYMRFGNLREMHQLKAAGVVMEFLPDDATRTIRIVAKVVDKEAWLKVKEGVYKGFSIGGRALSRVGNRVKKLLLREISLVDRPANPGAVFTMFKADGAAEAAAEGEGLSDEDLRALAQELTKTLNGRRAAGGRTEDHMKKLSKADAEARMRALKKSADEAFDKAIAKAADDMDEEACDKAMADIFSPAMFSVPEQKASGAGDLAKALRALAEGGVRKDDGTADLIKALGGAVLALNEKLDKVQEELAKPAPAKAAVKELPVVEKADDSKKGDDGQVDKDELKKAQDSKDPMAVLRVIHKAGGTVEQVG